MIGPVGSALVEIDAIDDEGAVDGVRECASHPQIVERLTGVVRDHTSWHIDPLSRRFPQPRQCRASCAIDPRQLLEYRRRSPLLLLDAATDIAGFGKMRNQSIHAGQTLPKIVRFRSSTRLFPGA